MSAQYVKLCQHAGNTPRKKTHIIITIPQNCSAVLGQVAACVLLTKHSVGETQTKSTRLLLHFVTVVAVYSCMMLHLCHAIAAEGLLHCLLHLH
jgi:hypothetical protein